MTYMNRSGLRPSRKAVSASFAGSRKPSLPFRVLVDLVQAVDLAILLLAGLFANAWINTGAHMLLSGASTAAFPGEFIIATAAGTAAVAYALSRLKSYQLARLAAPVRLVLPAGAALLAGAAVCASCLLILRQGPDLSVRFAGLWLAASAGGFCLFRAALGIVIRNWVRSGRLDRRVAVVGVNELAEAFISRVFNHPWSRTCIVGLYSDLSADTGMALSHASPSRFAVRGDIDTLLLDCRLRGVDAVVIALPAEAADEIRDICAKLRHVVADIFLAPEVCKLDLPRMQLDELGATPLFPVSRKPMSNWRHVRKELFDRTIAAAALLFLLPLLVLVAVLIRLESPGPILFRQTRVGFNNNPFQIFKFRTMHAHLSDRVAARQTGRNDVRVTRFGRILRRLSIDELPQLLNVLKGDMSLVGPRPHAPGTSLGVRRVDEVLDEYAQRHRVKPGITGLAQIMGCRGEMATEDQVARRVRYDIEYIERSSVWLDVTIILRTLQREIYSRNAF